MMRHDCSSYAEAIKYAADTTLVQEDEITIRELIQLLAEQVDEVDEVSRRLCNRLLSNCFPSRRVPQLIIHLL